MNNTAAATPSTTAALPTTCTRCGERITLSAAGSWVTGHSGWILPSHLNNTCDGIHLHTAPEEQVARVAPR